MRFTNFTCPLPSSSQVGLPGVLNAYETVGQKTELINRNGLGKEGWETLENVNDARNRY